MAQLLLVRGAKQLLTLRGPAGVRRGAALDDLSIIEDGSILIQDGLIACVGSTRRVENLKEARHAAEIAVNGAVVMPGFVDPALQLCPPSPALSASAALKPFRAGDFFNESLGLMRSCLQHGTLNAQLRVSAEGRTVRSDITLLRQLAKIGDNPIGMIRTWRVHHPLHTSAELIQEYREALGLLLRRKLIHAVEVTPETDVSVRDAVWQAAEAHGVDLNLLWNGGDADALSSLVTRVSPYAISSRCRITTAECDVLSQAPGPVVISPSEELVTAGETCKSVQRLARSGAAIALSSGYHTREMPTPSMQVAVALAVLRLGLTTEQAVSAATVNAACAAGIGEAVGVLEIGRRADLLVLNISDYRELPRRFGVNQVGMAIRQGKVIFNRTGWKVSAA